MATSGRRLGNQETLPATDPETATVDTEIAPISGIPTRILKTDGHQLCHFRSHSQIPETLTVEEADSRLKPERPSFFFLFDTGHLDCGFLRKEIAMKTDCYGERGKSMKKKMSLTSLGLLLLPTGKAAENRHCSGCLWAGMPRKNHALREQTT